MSSASTSVRGFGGWRLTACAAAAVCAMIAALLVAHGAGVEGLGAVIRNTARTSFALFLAAFAAPALDALRPAPWTRWLRENVPYLFAAFAASHLFHAAAIFALARLTGGASLADRSTAVIAAGGLVYLFILLAAATAFPTAAAWINRRAWARRLVASGLYVIWLTFLNSYGERAAGELFYLPFAALLVAALLVRLLAAAARPKSVPRAGVGAGAPSA